MKYEIGQKIATREAYGNALAEFGANPDILVFDADLAASTKTITFKKSFPDRFFDCGIAEGNMMAVAAGVAAAGKIPFASTFAMFAAGRAYEQIRNSIGYPHLNVKIGATHAGVSVGEDGATHQCNEDMALMRTIPGMVIINPADAVEARAAVKAAIEHNGPVYLRFGRLAVPVVFDQDTYDFEIGKGVCLKDGNDVTVIATGICVNEAMIAAQKLENEGVSVRVVNIHTIKPIDRDIVIESAKKTGKIITVEEHSIIGALGSAVCEVLAEEGIGAKVARLGVQDVYGKSGKAGELIKEFGLDADTIVSKIREML